MLAKLSVSGPHCMYMCMEMSIRNPRMCSPKLEKNHRGARSPILTDFYLKGLSEVSSLLEGVLYVAAVQPRSGLTIRNQKKGEYQPRNLPINSSIWTTEQGHKPPAIFPTTVRYVAWHIYASIITCKFHANCWALCVWCKSSFFGNT